MIVEYVKRMAKFIHIKTHFKYRFIDRLVVQQ